MKLSDKVIDDIMWLVVRCKNKGDLSSLAIALHDLSLTSEGDTLHKCEDAGRQLKFEWDH